MKHTSIVWFRNDLRLHDNEALTEALDKGNFIVPVYVFDERVMFGRTKFGFEKVGKFRTKFLIEAVLDLKKNLQNVGSDLIIRYGKPEVEIFQLAKIVKSSWVYCNRERTYEELQIQDRLENQLWTVGQELRYARGKMLFHTADLPFPISQVPDTFSAFRKEVENFVVPRDPFPSPTSLKFPPIDIDSGQLPSMETFGKDEVQCKFVENEMFIGGESVALDHLDTYLWKKDLPRTYKETRDQLLGWDFSTKFSAWLSIGCLSPKYIMAQVKKYEESVIKNESTYWIFFELMWRDFFRLMGKKHGSQIFRLGGIRNEPIQSKTDFHIFNRWARGKTGIPFIDANMIQLNETGFMSNRGRQIVSSFLIKDLGLNWLMGAEYFESLLIDYDPCSNYVNWNYIAGIGNDPRDDRYFNIVTQAKKYDAYGEFVKFWLPQLKDVPASFIHTMDQWGEKDIFYDLQLYDKPILQLS